MDFSKGVLFDPGYSKYVLPFAPNIDAAYNMIFSAKSQHQRKFKFQMIYPQLIKILENTVSFYLGCLFWATFIKKNFENSPKEILDNCYIGREIDEESMLYEVNYAISYLDKLAKDCKYYLGKQCDLPSEWKEILMVYRDFLKLNDFLVSAKTTSDIKLPNQIQDDFTQETLNKILEQIKAVTQTGELYKLFDLKDLIIKKAGL